MQPFNQAMQPMQHLSQLSGLGTQLPATADDAPERWYLTLGWDLRGVAAVAAEDAVGALEFRAAYAGRQVDAMIAAASKLTGRSADSATLRAVLVAAEKFEAIRADAEALRERASVDATWLRMAAEVPTAVYDALVKSNNRTCYRCGVAPTPRPGSWAARHAHGNLWFWPRTQDVEAIEFAYSWVALCFNCFQHVYHDAQRAKEGYVLRQGVSGQGSPMLSTDDDEWFTIDINGRRGETSPGRYGADGKWQLENRY